ncbi:MAG: trans-2-enoyl-CoA reductase family protein [Francisellaceae bacterium]|jgi:enoyl-[acyl-carrier protein] reductase / trans-2-enoyl-CoA reductase (NAD+)|nr:trans-2-enoyl-CoA reductase family protein [Francisellaceae bacterium]MBT6207206.1 trans-2-enoyl-CoA reductase family protein [Francisellaceae bacterium]MBT6538405.1 trans-2-enoyl-CoA reductase family protein [Francisellaceae bacterium]
MIVGPKIRGFLCTTAHPDGCDANVKNQIDLTKKIISDTDKAPKNVLVIGASTGYGLSSRIVSSFGYGAKTLGIVFERPASGKRTASAGWYNTVAFEKYAADAGIYAKTINGDAFSDEVKQKVIDIAKNDSIGKFDLIIYSLAAPRRNDPRSGNSYSSVLKPFKDVYSDKTVDFMNETVSTVSIDPANDQEAQDTIKVMGGEDWTWWIESLDAAGLIADNAVTLAYSYIGPELTYPIYRSGTIGKAKEDLENQALELNKILGDKYQGGAYVSVNKAVVTQASAAIPVVPLYMSLLYKIMKDKGIHEGCIEQIIRLFNNSLYSDDTIKTDEKGRIRVDDWEMKDDVQRAVANLWPEISTDTLSQITDIKGYQNDFYQLFGFNVDSIDYSKEVDIELPIPSIE